MKTKTSHQNRFLRIITIPIRALGKARDFYVRSMTSHADKFSYGSSFMGMPGTNCVASLPRSFSVNSSKSDDNEDLRELIRAASVRSLDNSVDISLLMQQQVKQTRSSNSGLQKMPPRSCSLSMARIDEEKPACAFGDEKMNIIKQKLVFPRSRSCSANKKSLLF